MQKRKMLLRIQSNLTVTILAILCTLSQIFKFQRIFPSMNMSIVLTDVFHTWYDFAQYIVDLTFIYKYGRENSQAYLRNYKCFDKMMNSTNLEEIKNRVTKLVCIFLALILLSSVIDFTAWSTSYGIIAPIAFAIAYVFWLMKILTNLDLTAQVINIECRLRAIGDVVQVCYESTSSLTGGSTTVICIEDSVTNRNWFYANGKKDLNTNNPKNKYLVQWLSQCYLLLNEQCIFISKFYGIRLTLITLSLIIDVVRFLNVAVRLAVGSEKTPFGVGYFPMVASVMRCVLCSSVLTCVVQHCEQAYRQRDRICLLADHMLINKNPDEVLRAAIIELRNLVQSRPICFNMAFFFIFNYPLLVSVGSATVTYTIILLQSI